MRVTIDNLDGRGAVDYSGAMCAEHALTIERTLDAIVRRMRRDGGFTWPPPKNSTCCLSTNLARPVVLMSVIAVLLRSDLRVRFRLNG